MSIPKEPRQLMINIMYLVLTAMLALNVSAEIINAFFLIDRGIEGSNKVFDKSNDFTQATLDKNASQDAAKYAKLVEAGNKVRTISKEFNSYIDGVREELVGKEGYYAANDDKHPGQPKNYKNKDATTKMLVNDKKGDEIEKKVMDTRQQVLSIINELKGMEGTAIDQKALADLENSITLGISEDWKASKKPSWAHFTFNQMPVAAVFPIFRKFENDMKSSEAAVLNFLVNQVGAVAFKVDNFIPISSAKKSYIIAGETYESSITIGASSKSVYENMSIRVNGSPQKVENGVAKFTTTPSTPGVNKYKVDISLKNPTTGKTETYSEEFEYEVGLRSISVAADKMNVFYIGVDNPVSVAAAGVSSNTLNASISGGGGKMRKVSNGKYVVNVTQPTNECRVTVTGEGVKDMKLFRVKRIPDPVAQLGRSKGGNMPNGEFKAQEGLVALLESFDFDAKCQIQGYDLVHIPKREDAVDSSNPGGRFNEKSQRLVARAKPGDTYFIRNIKARCPGDTAGRDLGTMAFQIR